MQVFEHYLQEFISTGLVNFHAKSLSGSYPAKEGKIALMHIDSPKTYTFFKNILFRFFPLLKRGSIVIFQDYFYHWSGTLISAVQLLTEIAIFKPLFTAASSMVVEVLEQPDFKVVGELDLKMSNTYLPAIIDNALKSVSLIKVDRREHFQPRLNLAKIQLLMESEKHADASHELNRMMLGKQMNFSHLLNLSELMSRNFKYN